MKRVRAFTGIALIVAIGAGLLVFERRHIRKHLPLIEAERVVAEKEGPELLLRIGHPENTIPYDEGLKLFPNEDRDSMWHGTKVRVSWDRTWETQGNFEAVEKWFHEKLTGMGWDLVEEAVPVMVESSYRKDKWMLLFRRQADFSTDLSPKVRYALFLEWDYLRGPVNESFPAWFERTFLQAE